MHRHTGGLLSSVSTVPSADPLRLAFWPHPIASITPLVNAAVLAHWIAFAEVAFFAWIDFGVHERTKDDERSLKGRRGTGGEANLCPTPGNLPWHVLGKIHMPNAQAVDYHLLMLVAEIPIAFCHFEMCAPGAVTQNAAFLAVLLAFTKPLSPIGISAREEAAEGEMEGDKRQDEMERGAAHRPQTTLNKGIIYPIIPSHWHAGTVLYGRDGVLKSGQ